MKKTKSLIKYFASILTVFLILIFSSCAFSVDPVSVKLNEIEKNYYGYTYNGTNNSRLSRIETAIYGVASNKPEKTRAEKIYKDLNLGTSAPAASLPSSSTSTQQNSIVDIGPKAEKGIKYPVVDKIENKVLKKTYLNDDIYIRLSRLEKQIFKKESTASLNERVDALRSKVLGGDRFADSLNRDGDSSTDEIVLERGYNYNGYEDSFGSGTGGAAPGEVIDSDDSSYNYYSYENSKNRVPEIQSTPVDSRNSDDSAGNYSAQSYDLDVLEKNIFGKRFTAESSSQRLARLESQVFQRTFKDSEEARVQRLLAASTAKKTSQEYDSNKWARRVNTGIQIGSILLMVLAMIL